MSIYRKEYLFGLTVSEGLKKTVKTGGLNKRGPIGSFIWMSNYQGVGVFKKD